MTHSIPVLEAVEIPIVEPQPTTVGEHSVLGLAELLLKDREQADELLRDDNRQAELIPRFLIIALASFTIYAWAMILLLHAVPKGAMPTVLADGWSFSLRPTIGLWLAYALGLVAATGICLPSFYFYGLLAGVRITFPQIVTHCLKGMASTAIMLMGILPIYVAVALGMLVFAAPLPSQQVVLSLGLILPFLAGLWGVYSIYRGFMRLADTLPGRCRADRTCFLRRLTLSWAACYTAVTPLMIHALWTHFTR
jgi:hypothetical protein